MRVDARWEAGRSRGLPLNRREDPGAVLVAVGPSAVGLVASGYGLCRRVPFVGLIVQLPGHLP